MAFSLEVAGSFVFMQFIEMVMNPLLCWPLEVWSHISETKRDYARPQRKETLGMPIYFKKSQYAPLCGLELTL